MNGATRIRVVVFDLDDTLFAERDYVAGGYGAVGEHLRRSLGRGEAFEDWLWDRFLTGSAEGAFDALNLHFGLELSSAEIRELVEVYRRHAPRIELFDGMADILGRIRERYAVGLLSDGFLPGQRLKFQALNVERFFDAVLFTEELGRESWKPSTRGFEVLAKKLDVPHGACAYVADNPTKDFLPGNKLGWRTIQYLHPGQLYSAAEAPQGGNPQVIVRDGGGLHLALIAVL